MNAFRREVTALAAAATAVAASATSVLGLSVAINRELPGPFVALLALLALAVGLGPGSFLIGLGLPRILARKREAGTVWALGLVAGAGLGLLNLLAVTTILWLADRRLGTLDLRTLGILAGIGLPGGAALGAVCAWSVRRAR